MEQQDHIATLCVAGTVGIAATGLALGVQTETDNTYSITPGKRKWPGASALKSNPALQPSLSSRRVVSQPATSTTPATQDRHELYRSSSLFRRLSKGDVRATAANDSDMTGSRASSMNRSGMFRPRTADTRSTSEQRDPSANSSWLKRLSSISSPRGSSPSAPSSNLDSTPQSVVSIATEDKNQSLPNKLVKRSTSQRALSNDHAKGTFLRRPATSHQRSATVQEWSPREISFSTPATPCLSSDSGPIWRPFFERGYARKRHTNTNFRDGMGPRTIPPSNMQQPTLMLGSQIEPSTNLNDQAEKAFEPQLEARTISTGRQRLRRSLSSVHRAARRRHFTDPTVKVTTEAVNGMITSAVKQSPLSPTPQTSPFDVKLPHGSSPFTSSPPLMPIRHRFSFRKRQSTAPSDPTTISSDNDTRVFTDDDSMDFQSDTAYDSLTTRATVSSHSAFRTTKLENVFDDSQAMHAEEADATLARLVQKATLSENMIDDFHPQQSDQLRGIGISGIEEQGDEMDVDEGPVVNVTPVKPGSSVNDDYNITPVPQRLHHFGSLLRSSPPVLVPAAVNTDTGTPEFVIHQTRLQHEDDDIDWSPKSDKRERTSDTTLRQHAAMDAHTLSSSPAYSQEPSDLDFADEEENDSDKRLSSIFDWSEHQRIGVDALGGMLVRPKTVHGKQGHDGSRSRSSGRKGPTQLHLRSQSVPNNRDPNSEQPPPSTSKFGTWGLGHKPVSEEWSDDFEFDDLEEDASPDVSSDAFNAGKQGTLRGVKVPQAIIDRQASVHVQFGQVQEFMLLVEELRNLRARGAALQLLDTHSKQLWEDAESIIDLATINNEEDDPYFRPASPTSSDIFGDEVSVASKGPDKLGSEESKRNSTAFRSISSPATPPHGRPRGESLAQAKTFLQSIHQSRSGLDSSPMQTNNQPQRKLPFDTQDLKDLVTRSGVITRALKEIIRKAEGLSASPSKTPPKTRDPAFSQIFNAPDSSPCPPFRKPGLPKSHSANSYLSEKYVGNDSSVPPSPTPTALVL